MRISVALAYSGLGIVAGFLDAVVIGATTC